MLWIESHSFIYHIRTLQDIWFSPKTRFYWNSPGYCTVTHLTSPSGSSLSINRRRLITVDCTGSILPDSATLYVTQPPGAGSEGCTRQLQSAAADDDWLGACRFPRHPGLSPTLIALPIVSLVRVHICSYKALCLRCHIRLDSVSSLMVSISHVKWGRERGGRVREKGNATICVQIVIRGFTCWQ